jgi:dihydroorotate dehydrogenase (NAD+) catalytic subunit
MINSIGLAGEGLEVFLSERLPTLLALPCPLLLSIGGFALEEYVSLASGLRGALEQGEGDWSTRVGIELNISCPNVHSGCVSIGSDARETRAVVEAVRSTWPGLLVVKLTPNVTDISTIALAAVEAGADAVAAVNTFKGIAIDRGSLRPYLGNQTGGVSGPAIKPLALRLVYELFESVDVPIIGIGGVACVQDVLDFMACGARVVAVGSSAFRDPWIVRSLVAELADELVARGTTLADLVGCAHEEHTLGCTSA